MELLTKFIGMSLAVVVMFLIIAAILAVPVMYMWNYVVPDLFGLPEMNFWQALWGTLLARLLFTDGTTNVTTRR